MAAIGTGWATDAWIEAGWITGAWSTAVAVAGAAPSALRKRRWVLPDGRRFYGTDKEAAALVAQIRAAQERAAAEKPKLAARILSVFTGRKAAPPSVKAGDLFDIPVEMTREPAVALPLETVYLNEIDLQRALNAAAMAAIWARQRREEEDIEILLLAA